MYPTSEIAAARSQISMSCAKRSLGLSGPIDRNTLPRITASGVVMQLTPRLHLSRIQSCPDHTVHFAGPPIGVGGSIDVKW